MAASTLKVRSDPGLSAYQLADFMTSTPAGQITILRNAKFTETGKPKVIQYQIVRAGIALYFTSPTRDRQHLIQTEEVLRQRAADSALTTFAQDDARRSIEALEAFQRTQNSLDLQGNVFEVPPRRQMHISLADVSISVQPDAIVMGSYKQEERIGSLFLRLAKGGETEAAETNRAAAYPILAALAHLNTAKNLTDVGAAHAPLSMVIDVQRGHVTRATPNLTRRVANIEAACRFIAAIWPSI